MSEKVPQNAVRFFGSPAKSAEKASLFPKNRTFFLWKPFLKSATIEDTESNSA
jgi:hypothetical protein